MQIYDKYGVKPLKVPNKRKILTKKKTLDQ